MADESKRWPSSSKSRALLVGSCLLAAALILIVWQLGLKHRFVPKNFGVVVPGEIYRSGRLTPSTLASVSSNRGIRTVIDFGAYHEGTDLWRRIRETDDRFGINRVTLPMSGDATGNPDHYVQALRILADESTHPVLVQCGAGAQRTGMAIVLYRTVIEDVPLEEAYRESFDHGHDPHDNWKFLFYLGKNLDRIKAAYHESLPAPDHRAEAAVADAGGDVDPPIERPTE